MNFWATKVLGAGAPAPAQQVPPAFQPQAPVAAPAATPWWANDYTQALQQVQPQQQVPHQPAPEEQAGMWGTVKGSMSKAKSARSSETCPECGTGNIFRPEGQPNAMLQCYECGYNPRFSQTGGAGGLPSDASGPATPARQLATAGAGGVSQFSPSTIVGRI